MLASIIMIVFWIVALFVSLKIVMRNVKKSEERGLFNDE